MSTKAKVIQGIIMYEVIAKQKVALDQLRDGLKILGILDEMQRFPQLFECAFIYKNVELTSEIVNDCFKYADALSEQNVKSMVTRFIEESSSIRLTEFLQYCTRSKSIPLVSDFQIKVKFHREGHFHSSTCTFTLTMPHDVTSYGLLEAALNAVNSTSDIKIQ